MTKLDTFDPYKKIANNQKAVTKYKKTPTGKHKAWEYNLKANYGLTVDEYNEKLKEQNHKCAICGLDEIDNKKKLAVDHCHVTGKVRELLCINCNLGLGYFKDNINSLSTALSYLLKHK
jgi:hypothetical protein